MRPERSLAVMALAVFCVALVLGAQTVTAVAPAIVFALGIGIGILVEWLVGFFSPPPAGVTIPDHLSLFYNTKCSEIDAITTNTLTMASLVNETGFYLGRKAQYAAMQYINTSDYNSVKWKVLWDSGVLNETGQLYNGISQGYANIVKDCIRYSTNFVGTYATMDFKLGTTSTKSWTNFSVNFVFGAIRSTDNANNMGEIVYEYYVAGPFTLVYRLQNDWGSSTTSGHVKVFDLLNSSNLLYEWTYGNQDVTKVITQSYGEGLYKVSIRFQSNYYPGSTYNYVYYWFGIDGLILSPYPSNGVNPYIWAHQTNTLYSAMTFSESVNSTSYTVNVNNDVFALWALRSNLDTTINFASALAQSYHTTLRGLGYTDPTQIPANITIPPVDIAFISNEDMNRLSAAEIYAIYIAYLKALGNLFNSTSYQQLLRVEPANVTLANMAVKVIGSMSRNGTVYTNGTLYLQVYQNLTLTVNQSHVLNASGLVYNLDERRVFTYQPGDVLNVSQILVYDPRSETGYSEAINATIRPMTVEFYIHMSDSGQPTGGQQPVSAWTLPEKLKSIKWYLLGGAVFVLLIVFAPILNEMGKQWVRAWR